jgi:hypothetical protein
MAKDMMVGKITLKEKGKDKGVTSGDSAAIREFASRIEKSLDKLLSQLPISAPKPAILNTEKIINKEKEVIKESTPLKDFVSRIERSIEGLFSKIPLGVPQQINPEPGKIINKEKETINKESVTVHRFP